MGPWRNYYTPTTNLLSQHRYVCSIFAYITLTVIAIDALQYMKDNVVLYLVSGLIDIRTQVLVVYVRMYIRTYICT